MNRLSRDRDNIIDNIRQANGFRESLDCVARSHNLKVIFEDNKSGVSRNRKKINKLDKDETNSLRIVNDLVIDVAYLLYDYYFRNYSDEDFSQNIEHYSSIIENTLKEIKKLKYNNQERNIYNDLLEIWKKFLISLELSNIWLKYPRKRSSILTKVELLFSSYQFVSIATFLIGIIVFILFVIFGVVK